MVGRGRWTRRSLWAFAAGAMLAVAALVLMASPLPDGLRFGLFLGLPALALGGLAFGVVALARKEPRRLAVAALLLNLLVGLLPILLLLLIQWLLTVTEGPPCETC